MPANSQFFQKDDKRNMFMCTCKNTLVFIIYKIKHLAFYQ